MRGILHGHSWYPMDNLPLSSMFLPWTCAFRLGISQWVILDDTGDNPSTKASRGSAWFYSNPQSHLEHVGNVGIMWQISSYDHLYRLYHPGIKCVLFPREFYATYTIKCMFHCHLVQGFHQTVAVGSTTSEFKTYQQVFNMVLADQHGFKMVIKWSWTGNLQDQHISVSSSPNSVDKVLCTSPQGLLFLSIYLSQSTAQLASRSWPTPRKSGTVLWITFLSWIVSSCWHQLDSVANLLWFNVANPFVSSGLKCQQILCLFILPYLNVYLMFI